MTRKPVRAIPSEDQEQALLCKWLREQGIRFYAIPNGGKRNLLEAVKLKRLGTAAGIPDLCVPIPSKQYHGLYIELKRKDGGKVSNNQIEWLSFLRENGYFADIANGFDEAKEMVEYYFSLS